MPTSRKFLTPLVTAVLFGAGILAPAAAAHAVTSPVRPTSAVSATASITVAQAIAAQGSTGTVTGYVVGQPTSSSTVVTSGFPSGYALALADTAGETAIAKILYVQIPSAFRAGYGLKTNPTSIGKKLDVTGSFAAYFSHPGLVSASAFAVAGGGGTDPGDPGGGTGDPGAYYTGTSGLTGAALRSKLHTIISTGVTTLSYAEVWDGIKDVDQDPNNSNNVLELYTGRSISKSSNGSGVENWNREHVYAKSHGDFGTANGPGTDLNHLRAADVSVNSSRGNKDFAEGGTENSEAKGNYSTTTSWEPRDADKGDVARMVLYMDIRWEGGDGKPNLGINDITGNNSAPYMGKLSDLKKWNAQDPPDAFEKTRNQKVFDNWQHNRNPFIDHPEWVAAIYGS
ncbi:MAG: endonuclease [Nakamurella sp.]